MARCDLQAWILRSARLIRYGLASRDAISSLGSTPGNSPRLRCNCSFALHFPHILRTHGPHLPFPSALSPGYATQPPRYNIDSWDTMMMARDERLTGSWRGQRVRALSTIRPARPRPASSRLPCAHTDARSSPHRSQIQSRPRISRPTRSGRRRRSSRCGGTGIPVVSMRCRRAMAYVCRMRVSLVLSGGAVRGAGPGQSAQRNTSSATSGTTLPSLRTPTSCSSPLSHPSLKTCSPDFSPQPYRPVFSGPARPQTGPARHTAAAAGPGRPVARVGVGRGGTWTGPCPREAAPGQRAGVGGIAGTAAAEDAVGRDIRQAVQTLASSRRVTRGRRPARCTTGATARRLAFAALVAEVLLGTLAAAVPAVVVAGLGRLPQTAERLGTRLVGLVRCLMARGDMSVAVNIQARQTSTGTCPAGQVRAEACEAHRQTLEVLAGRSTGCLAPARAEQGEHSASSRPTDRRDTPVAPAPHLRPPHSPHRPDPHPPYPPRPAQQPAHPAGAPRAP